MSSGVSVFPISRGGGKNPSVGDLPFETDAAGRQHRSGKPFERSFATVDDLSRSYDRPQPAGIAVVGGVLSGNHLAVLDFETRASLPGSGESRWLSCRNLTACQAAVKPAILPIPKFSRTSKKLLLHNVELHA